MQWAGPIFTHPLDEPQLERYLQAAEGEHSSRRIFKGVETHSGDVVGHIELNNIDRRNRSAAVSRVLVDSQLRGKGFGAELVQKVVEVGFGELGLHRLELFVFDFNAAAIACYQRAGFSIEGRLREARRVGGEYWSLYVMSLLASKWNRRERIDLTPLAAIRRAELGDLAAITDIYNEAILTTTATFDTDPKTADQRLEWFRGHDDRHPIMVAVLGGQVVGWASVSKWSDRQAYDDTAETSFYVKSDFRGRGIGRQLKLAIIGEARRLGFHTLIARVAEGNDASLHLNESCGFVHIGTMREVGRKFGRFLDVHILQKILD